MTNEQIKQRAEEYALKRTLVSTDSFHGMVENYLAGAHSRDEEINELEKKVSALETVIVTARATISTQEAIIKDIRNPWKDASVEKPPYDPDCDDETSVYVIVRQEQGNVLEAYYDYDNNDWRDREHNWRLQDPTHWMPIPELLKGDEK